jgi:haloalkane dehalogenase
MAKPVAVEPSPGILPEDYPFQPHSFRCPTGRGGTCRMHYIDEGSGETLLFVHGTPTWSYEWRHVIAALRTTHRCVAMDHLGFGKSERPEDFAYTPEVHAQNVLALVRALDLRDITLVVHDFGGPIGLPVALEESERVKRVVVINSWMWSFEGDKEMEKKSAMAGGAFGRFLYRYGNFSLKVLMPYAYGDKRKLTSVIHKRYLECFPDRWSRGAVLWALAKSLLGSSAHYRGLWEKRDRLSDRPLLIVWGLKDRAFDPRFLATWKKAFPQARVHELPESGHWPHEEEPEAVIRALRGFLSD